MVVVLVFLAYEFKGTRAISTKISIFWMWNWVASQTCFLTLWWEASSRVEPLHGGVCSRASFKALLFLKHVYDTCFIKTKENSFTRRIGNQQLPNPFPSATTIRTVLHEQSCDIRQWRLRFHKPCQSDWICVCPALTHSCASSMIMWSISVCVDLCYRNVLPFRSFHNIHPVSRTRLSKTRLRSFKISFLETSHQSTHVAWKMLTTASSWRCAKIEPQTSLLKTQPVILKIRSGNLDTKYVT